ncbi:nucleotide exchange factor SIL1-like [Rhopilema esculentum]|uniref:nucleotide exchange factor SIL1-like n=1 Tax=Rhopilema esculentum TaxID=499914 RepID=UPI0031DE79CB
MKEMKVLAFFFIFILGGVVDGQDTGLILVDTPENVSTEDVVKATIEESSESFIDKNAEPFIPTKDWQVVKNDQSVPAGLHIRMNLQTGLKEAKLMDGDDGARFLKQKVKQNEGNDKVHQEKHQDGPNIVMSDEMKDEAESYPESDKIYFTKQHLKDALKDFRDKFHDDGVKSDGQEISRSEAVKQKFRSIEEIRKELEDHMGWKVKSDAQLMKIRVEILRAENATKEEQSHALEDLEYYVHQIDNAVDLEKMHGLQVVIQFLNNSDLQLQEKAAKVIGAAVQSNPKAQLAALEHGAMQFLLRQISYSSTERLRKTALFALSALIRTNSKSQIVFLKLDGLNILLKCIETDKSTALKIKAVTLVSDLIVEQSDVKVSMVKNGKMTADESTPLMKALIKRGWCALLPGQLNTEDYDSIEKVLAAISASAEDCKLIRSSSRDVAWSAESILLRAYCPLNELNRRSAKIDGLECVLVDIFKIVSLNFRFKTRVGMNSLIVFYSNPKAQLAALEHGAMQFLLRQISYSSTERLRKTALFALSALIRTNSKSQIVFLKLDGLNILLKCIETDKSTALKIKAVTLVSDLIVEQSDVKVSMVKNGKMTADESTPLMKALIKRGWCALLPGQLNTEDYDSIEKVLAAISASAEDCKLIFNKNDLRTTLLKVRENLKNEINNEEDKDFKSYLQSLTECIDNILSKLGQLFTL